MDSTSLTPVIEIRAQNRAYTLFELLITIAVIGILGGIAGVVISKNLEKTQAHKLESDVQSLNQSVDLYLASGGSFSGKETAEQVIAKLKTKIKAGTEHRHAGVLTGSSVDLRMEAVMLSKEEAKEAGPRAVWLPKQDRFVVTVKKVDGVKEFRINEDLDLGDTELVEEVRSSTMLYASEDGWVWDYQDTSSRTQISPTAVSTNEIISNAPGKSDPKLKLYPPKFSLSGGSYLLGEFDLSIELNNPNDSGISDIYYQIDGGAETLYTSPFTVSADQQVIALVKASDTQYINSIPIDNTYQSRTEQLAQPTIATSEPHFGVDSSDQTVTITITETNDASKSPEIFYSLNGGTAQKYSGAFQVDRITYEATGLDISAWVESSSISYTNSPTTDEFLKVKLLAPDVNIAFTSSGAKNMEITITDQNVAGISNIRYRIIDNQDPTAAGGFLTYTGPIPAAEADYPDGYKVETYATPIDGSIYVDSDLRSDGGVFFGVPIKGRTIFVIDSSGSMGNGRLDVVKSRMADMIDKFNGSHHIAIVEFDSTASTKLNWNKMDGAGKTLALAAVNDLQAGNGTRYQQGFNQVDNILSAIVASGQIMPEEVVFLTDGAPSSSGDDDVAIANYEALQGADPYYPADLTSKVLRAAWARAQTLRETYDISVSTIAIDTGDTGEEYKLLKKMAEDNNEDDPKGKKGWISAVKLALGL